jgi:hypothetical protein
MIGGVLAVCGLDDADVVNDESNASTPATSALLRGSIRDLRGISRR